MGRTIEIIIIPVLLCVIITIIRGLHFILSMRNAGNTEINTGTYDVSRLPLGAAPRARSGCGIVHTNIFVVIDDMSELALEYLRGSLHYIRILLQRRAGLGYGGTLLYSSSVNLPSGILCSDVDKQTISTS